MVPIGSKSLSLFFRARQMATGETSGWAGLGLV
jgi:hypothetical protein